MPLASSALSLDIVKSPFAARSQRVCVRVGDRGAYGLSVELLKDGSPLPMSGLSATLKAVLADGTYAEAACAVDDASAGLVSCTLGGAFAAVPGACREAYVEVAQGASVVGSTGSFELLVERGADLSAGQAKAYASRVDALAERAEGLADGLAATIASADITVSATRLDPGSDPTATVTGGGLAKHVELGIPSAAAGVSCEAGPAGMVTVHGAADDAPLVGAVVYGETRRNLWPHMATITANGVTMTSNEDGSFTLSGTASGDTFFAKPFYTVPPSTQVCLSIDKALSVTGGNAYVRLEQIGADENEIGLDKRITATTSGAVSTIDGSAIRLNAVVSVRSGATVSGTYRVMLNEGATPAPWSPPGLASVEGVEARACGVNLARAEDLLRAEGWSVSGGVYHGQAGGLHGAFSKDVGKRFPHAPLDPGKQYAFYVEARNSSATAAGNTLYIQIVHKDGTLSYDFLSGSSTEWKNMLAVSATGKEVDRFAFTYGYGNNIHIRRLSIYEYVPGSAAPDGSTTACPVPLPAAHPYLASLPDGTRDELRVHWDGTAELVARVGRETFDGSADEGWVRSENSNMADGCVAKTFTQIAAGISANSFKCDKLKTYRPVTGDLDTANMKNYSLSIYSTEFAKWLYIRLGSGTTAESARTWLASNPTTVMYPLAAPVSYWYDGTAWSTTRPAVGSLPALRSAGDPTHVWAATEPSSVPAEVSAHVLLEGGKALGAEHDYVRRAVGALAAASSASE